MLSRRDIKCVQWHMSCFCHFNLLYVLYNAAISISCHQVASDQENIECPSCRQKTRLSASGVSGLQTNFYIGHMRDTLKTMHTAPKLRGCAKHSNQPLSFFCQTCSATICRDCTVLEHKDKDGHEIKDISDAESEQRTELRGEISNVKAAMDDLEQRLLHLEAERDNLTVAKDTALKSVDDAFEKYGRMLEVRRLQLTKEVMESYNSKQEDILKFSQEISGHWKELSEASMRSNRLLQRGPLAEVVSTKLKLQETTSKVKESVDKLDVGNNNVLFDPQQGELALQVAVAEVGRVYMEEALPASVKFDIPEIIASIPATITMEVHSYKGEPLRSDSVNVTITDHSGSVLETDLSWKESNGCELAFRPQIYGQHHLVVTFREQPIKGAEAKFKVKHNNPVCTFGGPGDGEGKFKTPRAIVSDIDGSLFVADTGNKVIQKLDRNGEFLYQFQINGGIEENSTCDLALNKRDGIIVCTETKVGSTNNPTTGNAVGIYNKDGTLKLKFDNKSMKCALCVATNSKGEIIISDYLMHCLFMHNPDGTFLRKIHHSGCFNHPAFICVTEDDMIIVSDTNNDTVQIFDQEGHFLHKFGKHGSGKGELKQPFGVACDGQHILVVDSGNKRLQVFSRDGEFVSVIDSKGAALKQPRGVALTDDGHVLVTDRDNHCIKKYRYK